MAAALFGWGTDMPLVCWELRVALRCYSAFAPTSSISSASDVKLRVAETKHLKTQQLDDDPCERAINVLENT